MLQPHRKLKLTGQHKYTSIYIGKYEGDSITFKWYKASFWCMVGSVLRIVLLCGENGKSKSMEKALAFMGSSGYFSNVYIR